MISIFDIFTTLTTMRFCYPQCWLKPSFSRNPYYTFYNLYNPAKYPSKIVFSQNIMIKRYIINFLWPKSVGPSDEWAQCKCPICPCINMALPPYKYNYPSFLLFSILIWIRTFSTTQLIFLRHLFPILSISRLYS